MQLQENKATNLVLAVAHIDGLVIHPGETFSVWKQVGRTSRKKVIRKDRLLPKDSQGKVLAAVYASCRT